MEDDPRGVRSHGDWQRIIDIMEDLRRIALVLLLVGNPREKACYHLSTSINVLQNIKIELIVDIYMGTHQCIEGQRLICE